MSFGWHEKKRRNRRTGEPGTGGVAMHVERLTARWCRRRLDGRPALGLFDDRSLRRLPQEGRACVKLLTRRTTEEFADFARMEKAMGLKVHVTVGHARWNGGTLAPVHRRWKKRKIR